QQGAFNAERERWIANGQAHFDSSEVLTEEGEDAPLQPGQEGIDSPVSGNLWQVNVEVGQPVREGEVLVVLESMKMEIPLVASRDGVVSQVRVQPGSSVRAGQCVVVLDKPA
ncbi:MAG: acetyl-CoA carboxylase biotin carboxyl carrier protein subunit, partial [Silvania sp.]|uniref:acetyl-CoA carboxylase biotin carboxyl carrier protein subunit n=1 Tax=Silvania sp. TaxID=3016633 RepID=UPI003EE496DC